MFDLKQNVQYVKGVGPARVKLLNNLEIYTLEDLLTYFPREYEDRSKEKNIGDLIDGEKITIVGKVINEVTINHIRRNMTILKTVVEDKTGNCNITWFNQNYVKQQIKRGEIYRFYGKVKKGINYFEMLTPIFEKVGTSKKTGKIMPVYPSTYGLTQTTIRKIVENALGLVQSELKETLPDYLISEYSLLDFENSINQIHFPTNLQNCIKARKRLVFEELLILQLILLELKNQNEENQGICFNKDVKISEVINNIPFHLTKAQLKVLEEIDYDMESKKTMNRLLEGDVGSGKTVVSIIASYKAVKSGYQVAIMVPTAILATQHFQEFEKLLKPFGICCELLLGATKPKDKKEILGKLENGEINVLIGTHALLTENVVFKNLGLVVTDEQHRFGVRQRKAIVSKGNNPDVLVMTATPIPRTLALILYGDLDISIIDELPPNRKKVETFAVTNKFEQRVNNFICKNIDRGRQVYIVCPVVEENENIEEEKQKADLKAVKEWMNKYQKEVFQKYRVECVYGKMKSKDKDEIMERFRKGEIDILVSTTVIEVGINVPNANIMVIENAEHFGLAQLHQLRGRVGRGKYQSYCILKYNSHCSAIARERIKTIQETSDGFIIAEKDLELRGTGEFFGTKQHGLPEFKIANLFVDMPMLKSVQSVALKIEREDKGLKQDRNKKLCELVNKKLKQNLAL